MSTGTDFLANLQKKTVKNTVQQKQQKRVNASAVDVSALLEAALGKRNLWKLWQMSVKVRMSPQLLLPLADTHQGKSTQQKPKNASDKNRHPKNQKTSWMPVSQLLSRRLWMPKGHGRAGHCRTAAEQYGE